MILEGLSFENGNLWWLLLLPLAIIPCVMAYEAFRRRVERAHSGRTLLRQMVVRSSGGRRIARYALVFVALELLAVAAQGPKYGLKEVMIRGASVDMAFVLDASRSMKVADIPPDRITAATVEIARLLDMTKGDRVTLVPFAGMAFIQTPLTLDHEVLKEYLRDLRVSDIPVPGTAIGRALALARQALGVGQTGRHANKAVVLFTDGENFEGDPLKVASELGERGVRIFAVGVGTPAGQPLPLLDEAGQVVGTAREKDGVTPVVSKLNEDLLKDMANRTGGKYFSLSGAADVASAIAAEIGAMEKAEYQSEVERLKEDRFQYPLGLALVLLVVAFLLLPGPSRRLGLTLLLLCLITRPLAAKGIFEKDHPLVAEALALLDEGKAGEAAKALEDLSQELGQRPDFFYDLALARDRQGETAQALEAIDKAISALDGAREVRPDWPSKARLLHAKGTILMHKAASEADAQAARQTWRQAVDALAEALVLDPEAEDTRMNLELAAGPAYPPCSKLDDKYEPNDRPEEAKFLEPDPNTLKVRADLLLCPDQEDYFKLPLRQGETLLAAVEAKGQGAPKPADVDLSALGPDGVSVRAGPSKQVRQRAMEAETVYLRVTGPKQDDGVPYVLDAQVIPQCPVGDDGMEPNDSREGAKPLPDGDHSLRVCPGNDDWFTYTEKQGTQKQVVLFVPEGEGEVELEVWSADGAPLDIAREGGTRVANLPKAQQDAAFTIRVFGGGQDSFYQLSVRDAQGQQQQDQQQQQNQQQDQQQKQQQDQQQQQGSQTMRELLEEIDKNEENLEAKEALRASPYREWVPEKDW